MIFLWLPISTVTLYWYLFLRMNLVSSEGITEYRCRHSIGLLQVLTWRRYTPGHPICTLGRSLSQRENTTSSLAFHSAHAWDSAAMAGQSGDGKEVSIQTAPRVTCWQCTLWMKNCWLAKICSVAMGYYNGGESQTNNTKSKLSPKMHPLKYHFFTIEIKQYLDSTLCSLTQSFFNKSCYLSYR